MNAWLNRCVFNLDLNRESVSEPRTLSGRLFQSLGAKYESLITKVPFSGLCYPRYYQESRVLSRFLTLAAAFCTICSLFIEDAGQPPSSALQ